MITVIINSDVTQSDGRKSVQATFTTDQGDSIVKHYLLNSDVDISAYTTSKIDSVDEQFKQKELSGIDNSLTIDKDTIQELLDRLKYSSLRDVLRYFIGRGIYTTDIFELIRIKKVAAYTLGKYTNTQIVNNSEFTLEQVELYYQRISSAVALEQQLKDIIGSAIDG